LCRLDPASGSFQKNCIAIPGRVAGLFNQERGSLDTNLFYRIRPLKSITNHFGKKILLQKYKKNDKLFHTDGGDSNEKAEDTFSSPEV
jgi:hypothetical protein